MGGSLMTLFFIFISFDDSERGVWVIFFLDTFASMSGRDGWERRYQDRDGQNWDTRSLFFFNGFLVLPRTPESRDEGREGFRPVTYCIATNVSHRRMMEVG